MTAVKVRNLTKQYRDTHAVDDVTFDVPEGEVVGFLGPNGAGKTTTLRVLLGLAKPTSGSVEILGNDLAQVGNEARRQIGYLPDVPGFPAWMTAPEFLRFTGELFGLSGGALNSRVDTLLGLAGLTGVTHKIGGFSRGMKQRLGVAQALVNAPRLLLLDEPTSALDPLGRKEVLTMIEALRGNATVLFSTHLLGDVERVCDSAIILNKGRVVKSGSIDELRSQYGGSKRVRLTVGGDVERLQKHLVATSWAHRVELEGDTVTFAVDSLEESGRSLPRVLDETGCALFEYRSDQVSLEEVFVQLTGAK